MDEATELKSPTTRDKHHRSSVFGALGASPHADGNRESSSLLGWANALLSQRGLSARELGDFGDGVLLINLAEQAYGTRLGTPYFLRPSQRFHKLDNIESLFTFLERNGLSLPVAIDRGQLAAGAPKPVVILLANLLRHTTLSSLPTPRSFQFIAGSPAAGKSNATLRDALITWAKGTFLLLL
eukprot:TRINITY_DN6927_c0_g2_i1.p1 TRINITY_DN6927_c0_g2~~TRINITY_DN6927_c0_g2_i1.p1  ORF type:complete len:183 (+),score=25.75 TRINITY_DN6927_c0_g2_i1:8-556(+)